MKITFVTSHLTVFGGGGVFVQNYANGLSNRGHIIRVIAQKIDQSKYHFNDKIELIEVGGPLPSNPLHWILFHKIKNNYLKNLNKLDSEILFSQYFPSNYICSKVTKNKDVKHVYYCHEPYRFFHDEIFYSNTTLKLKIFARILRLFFKKYDIEGVKDADFIICNSKFTRERIKKSYNRDGIVHYQGIKFKNDNLFKKPSQSIEFLHRDKKDKKYLFALGYSHHLKGIYELIRIYKAVLQKSPKILLKIGGEIEKQNKYILKKAIKELNISKDKVLCIGFVPDSNLNDIYSKSLVTLFTAVDEAFGYIPLESMKNGTPVVAFEGGPSETILNGKTGFIIKKNNIEAFSNKVLDIINNQKLRNDLSNNAKLHIKTNFAFKNSLLSLEETLARIYKI